MMHSINQYFYSAADLKWVTFLKIPHNMTILTKSLFADVFYKYP